MAKKAFGGRKKGIERGISKHRVRRKEVVGDHEGESNEAAGPGFLGISRSKFTSFGEKCFDFSFVCCEKMYLIGFRRAENGEYVPLGRKAQIMHYAVIFCMLAICMQRTWGLVEMFLYQEVRLQTILALNLVMVHYVNLMLAMGVLMRPMETMDLLNGWSHFSTSLKPMDPSYKFHPLDNMSACTKVTGEIWNHHAIVLAVALSTVLIPGPVYLCSTAERYGLIPGGILPSLVWRFMFMPLELLVVWPFMLISSFAGSCLFVEIGALSEYLQQLRSMSIRSMRSRRRVEQMYVQLELFNRINQVWIRYYFPPWIVALSCAIILSAFVTIRLTEIPFLVYVLFPWTAIQLMILIFWQSHDMLQVTRASEDILGDLSQHHAPYFQGMTREERVKEMKRSRAMRPLVFPLGDSEFSLSLPISTWDEVLNQTLFFLSL